MISSETTQACIAQITRDSENNENALLEKLAEFIQEEPYLVSWVQMWFHTFESKSTNSAALIVLMFYTKMLGMQHEADGLNKGFQ